MLYANKTTGQTGYTRGQALNATPGNVTYPSTATEIGDFVAYAETPRPEFDSNTHDCTPDGVAYVAGEWQLKWKLTALPADIAAGNLARVEANRIESLWQGAHNAEYNAISGSAIGLITMGVLQGKPKCIAVQGWIRAIWLAYYERKASGSADADFSVVGACPHSVPELMAELGL